MANPYACEFTELLQRLSKKYFPTLNAFAEATGVGKEYLSSARSGRRTTGLDVYTAIKSGLPGTEEEMNDLQKAYEDAVVKFVSPHRQIQKGQKKTRTQTPVAQAIPSDDQFLHLLTFCFPKSIEVLSALIGTIKKENAPFREKLQALRGLKRALRDHCGVAEKIDRYLQHL